MCAMRASSRTSGGAICRPLPPPPLPSAEVAAALQGGCSRCACVAAAAAERAAARGRRVRARAVHNIASSPGAADNFGERLLSWAAGNWAAEVGAAMQWGPPPQMRPELRMGKQVLPAHFRAPAQGLVR